MTNLLIFISVKLPYLYIRDILAAQLTLSQATAGSFLCNTRNCTTCPYIENGTGWLTQSRRSSSRTSPSEYRELKELLLQLI